MKRPLFTDEHRYPDGYMPACSTDIRKRFNAERRRIAEEKAKQDAKITPIKKRAKC